MSSDDIAINCDDCSSMWKVSDATHCWSVTGKRPPQPPDCPAKVYSGIIEKAFTKYTGDNQIAVLHGQNYYYKRLQNEPVLDESEMTCQDPKSSQ